MSIRRLGISISLPLSILLSCGSGEAPAAHAPAAGGSHQEEHPSAGPEASHPEPAAVSASDLSSAWGELLATRNAIAADVESGALGEIHAKAQRLAPLASAVLEHSGQLGAEQRARVASMVKQMPAVADRLHDAADAGNAAATRSELGRLDAVIELMRAQYPADALGPAADASAGAQDTAMHQHAMESALPGHEHSSRPLAATDAAPQASIVVKASEFAFEPRTLELWAGVPTRIELDNRGAAVEHSLLVHAPQGGDWIHLHAPAGGTDADTYRFDAAGSYEVQCTIPGHAEAGMTGRLVVATR